MGMEHKQHRNHTGDRIEEAHTKRFYQSLGIDVGSALTNINH
jgi:hypothetical protein